jgi:hypothetical protein
MNVFATNTTGCQAVARQTIADRVQDAERRATVRAIKAERRAERRASRRAAMASHAESSSRPLWTFRFVRPVN